MNGGCDITDLVRNYALLVLLMLAPNLAFCGLPETVAKVKKSVVSVGTFQRLRAPPAKFMGTGFVVSGGNHVITNAHVVPKELNINRKETLAVYFSRNNKVEMRTAKVLGQDREHDIALLEISGDPLPALKIGDDSTVLDGKLYAFTGFPIGMVLGVTPVTHRGIVSAITPIVIPANSSRNLKPKQVLRLRSPYKVFQLDAIAYPGNSGSPLYDTETGEVIGVVNSVFVKGTKESAITSPSGISYAIPGRYIEQLLRDKGIKY